MTASRRQDDDDAVDGKGRRDGIFTISLDFELHWGTRDKRTLSQYGANILGGRKAIPALLDLFTEFGIHATWAVVGSLCFESPAELASNLPDVLPRYENRRLEPFSELSALGEGTRDLKYFFAPELVALIRRTPHQEIGSHTFSHYYCLESGQTADMFSADLNAMRKVIRQKFAMDPQSLVFPRNQFTSAYLGLCAQNGIVAYRGNPSSWAYEPRSGSEETKLSRAIRLADSYVNLTGHHGHRMDKRKSSLPLDVPASRFLRPFTKKLRILEPLRLRRIERDLTYCAEKGLLYHLWWHPDNFGADTEANLAFLRKVLLHFKELEKSHGMQSLGMLEVAEMLGCNQPRLA